MKIYTSHTKPDKPALLVKEGFCWGAFFFGWIYLAWNGAWYASALNLAAVFLLSWLQRWTGLGGLMLGLLLLQGLFGRDAWRWNLALKGYIQGPVIAADNADQAYARLLTETGAGAHGR